MTKFLAPLVLLIGLFSIVTGSKTALAEQSKLIEMELNAQKQQGDHCQISFVMKNNLETSIKQLSMELVLFDQSSQVLNLLLLNSGPLPQQKTRVKQFVLKQTRCDSIGQFLINDVKQCEGEDLTPQKCLGTLKLNSRTKSKLGL